MASSSGKRLKTMASKRKEKELEQPHSNRFLSRKHEKHFKVVQDRRLLMERKVGMIPNFAPQFGEELLGNDWGKLATYPTPANIAVVKEFYTNARKIGDYPVENYLGYVRGHVIRYDPDSINNFLDTVWAGEQCQFALCAQLQSIHRGQVATAEMIVGMYDTPPAHRWTMEEFHNVVTWPEEPVQGGGAEAAEASAKEMDEDDADDDDAFEDAEDEEEEEDTNDSSD
ncbi:hypothetical protein LR48_Vigan553s002100 [Vigna angularis]|uniref:Putative plant transposon protein domain-containing protein n=1 Tax=Phaseolus angularis TaxID=3914 RepID=A0A0L9TDK3_PHAAN|nr:hypothetical protein LR48_Vigan553s002100 [Vigna angularis]